MNSGRFLSRSPDVRSPSLPLGLLLAAAATASCSDDASVTVKYVQGFTPGRASVSVFGVFRDGRMSADSWGPLSVPLSASLGGSEPCEPGFGPKLHQVDDDLYTSIDTDVRDNGITEELLTKLAPKAEGDLILAISIHGSIAAQTPNEMTQTSPGNAPPVPHGGLGGGRRGGHRGPPLVAGRHGLELSASLFSIPLHQLVARLSMTYEGAKAEDALRRFATEVGAMMPGATCRGWKWADKPPASGAPPSATAAPSAPRPTPVLPEGP